MPVARRDPAPLTHLSGGTAAAQRRRGRVESRLPGEMKAGEKEIMSRKEFDNPGAIE